VLLFGGFACGVGGGGLVDGGFGAGGGGDGETGSEGGGFDG